MRATFTEGDRQGLPIRQGDAVQVSWPTGRVIAGRVAEEGADGDETWLLIEPGLADWRDHGRRCHDLGRNFPGRHYQVTLTEGAEVLDAADPEAIYAAEWVEEALADAEEALDRAEAEADRLRREVDDLRRIEDRRWAIERGTW